VVWVGKDSLLIDLRQLAPEARLEVLAQHDPACREPASFALLRERNPTVYSLQPWPVLLTPEESRDLQEKSVALVELARTLPWRFFGGVSSRIAAYYGLGWREEVCELVLGEPNGVREAIYRGDYLMTPAGLRCLEINGGSGVGGWRVPSMAYLYEEVPVLAELWRASGVRLRYRETFFDLLAHFVRSLLAHPRLGAESELNVVIAVARSEDEHHFHDPASQAEGRRLYARALAEVAPGRQGAFAFCDYDELELRGGAVYRQGRRIHALFEQHVDQGATGRQLVGSFKAGRVALYTGPATRILMDKRNLVLLSENQESAFFAPEERQLIRSLVPWTRRAVRETTQYRGETVFLPDLLAAEREQLVLKRAFSHSGKDVYLGRNTLPASWTEKVTEALADGQWVVQEALESVPYRLLDEELGVVPHDVVWGLYVFGGEFRGGYLRVAPRERKSLLNAAQGASVIPFLEIDAAAGQGISG
jgi:hypothetical protein